jgi:hypothetical protein
MAADYRDFLSIQREKTIWSDQKKKVFACGISDDFFAAHT